MKRAVVVGGLAALVGGLLLFVLWEVYAPGDPPEIQLRGCDIVFLHESYKLDVGVGYRDYDLICVVKGSAPPPSCDDVIASYVRAKGPLAKGVDVRVLRDGSRTPDICRVHYRGDGTP